MPGVRGKVPFGDAGPTGGRLMGGDPRLTDTITQLYAAALGRDDDWSAVLERLRAVFAGDHVVLASFDLETGQRPLIASTGIGDKERAALLSPECAQLAQPFFHAAPVDVAVTRGAIVRDSEFARSALYNEFLRPAGGFHSVGAMVRGSTALMTAVHVCRPEGAGGYDQPDAVAFQALLPHLLMALDVRRRLELAEARCTGLERLLDRLTVAAFVTDSASRPRFMNAKAGALAARGDGLTLANGMLATASHAATRDLRTAIARIAQGADSAGTRLLLARPSLRPPLQVTLMPAWRLDPESAGAAPQGVALLVTEPDAPPPIHRDALADTFRLTQREADIAVLLAEGTDLAEIADALGLGLGTVRNHLKRVFQKTGVGSQAALVALARGFTRMDGV